MRLRRSVSGQSERTRPPEAVRRTSGSIWRTSCRPRQAFRGQYRSAEQTGPPKRTLDFSIFKDFPFTERWKLEFRAEALNLANTPQYNRA